MNKQTSTPSGVATGLAQSTQTVDTRIGKLDFEHGVPTQATVKNLYVQMDFQRACQLYLWALPAVGFERLQATLEGTTGALANDIAIFKDYWNLLVFFTPNATTPYTVGFLDLAKAGPVVMDVPAGPIAGSVMDFWQRPLSDLDLAGPDQGKGGKYVFVGPGQEAPTVPRGIVLGSPTFRVVFFYRALDPDPAKAETLSKGVSIYTWTDRNHPPATRFLTPDPDKIAKFTDPPRGMEYWERLAAFIQREPVEDRDRFFMAMLKPLGIEKGQPFKPDERQKKILTEGAFVGEAMAKANSFDMRVPDALYRPDALWFHFMMLDPMQDLANYSEPDERAAYFYSALGVTKGVVSKTPGLGQACLIAVPRTLRPDSGAIEVRIARCAGQLRAGKQREVG